MVFFRRFFLIVLFLSFSWTSFSLKISKRKVSNFYGGRFYTFEKDESFDKRILKGFNFGGFSFFNERLFYNFDLSFVSTETDPSRFITVHKRDYYFSLLCGYRFYFPIRVRVASGLSLQVEESKLKMLGQETKLREPKIQLPFKVNFDYALAKSIELSAGFMFFSDLSFKKTTFSAAATLGVSV